MKLRSHRLGVSLCTWTWDPPLWMCPLDYFNIAASSCMRGIGFFSIVVSTLAWDLGLWWSFFEYFIMISICTRNPCYLDYFCIVVNTSPWDPGLWLYLLTSSIEGNVFLREDNIGYLRRYPKG